MNASEWLVLLGRCTALLAVGAILVEFLFWLLRVESPRWRRFGWGTVLLLGAAWAPIDITLAWLPVTRHATHSRDGVVPVQVEPVQQLPAVPRAPAPLAELVARPPVVTPWAFNIDWPHVLLGLWLAGMIAQAGWLVGTYAQFSRRVMQHGQPADEVWLADYEAVLSEVRRRRAPRLLAAPRVGPLVWQGPRGAAIVVPSQSAQRFTREERRAILRHELAHWRRGDLWIGLAARALALPHWFNPAAAWAVKRFEEAAEWICDDMAREGDVAPNLAKALLHLGTGAGHALAPSAVRSVLGKRIERLTRPRAKESIMKRMVLCTAVVTLIAAAVVRVRLVAQDTPDISPANQTSSNETTTVPEAAREDLRYDGHDFAYWREVGLTDLSPNVLSDTLLAMLMFGKRGYANESVDVVLVICESYPSGFPGEQRLSPYDVLQELAPMAPLRLAAELDSKNPARRLAAATSLCYSGEAVQAVVPRLIQGVSEHDIQAACLSALGRAARFDTRAADEILRIVNTRPEVAIAAFEEASGAWPTDDDRLTTAMLAFLRQAPPGIRRQAVGNTSSFSGSKADRNEISIRIALLNDPDDQVRSGAVSGIASAAGNNRPISDPILVPQLIRAVAMRGNADTHALFLLTHIALDQEVVRDFVVRLTEGDGVPNDIRQIAIKALERESDTPSHGQPTSAVKAAADTALKVLEATPE